ncbi:putative translocon-associated protein subunit alpha [Blattamonas nauphoetae]|uniref:Translocon-associated protein subunit alpha n=1 Tax=Blattamonas nauphoetae TaxID=2049346 RepID=A0ABQ9XNJ8_9EUKA|nr:putative translocon-associated protein subunit alpha [Blattamonas nauphoetae]
MITLFLICLFTAPFRCQEDDSDDVEDVPPTRSAQSYSFRPGEFHDATDLLENIQKPKDEIKAASKLLAQHENDEIFPGDVLSILIGVENQDTDAIVLSEIVTVLTDPFERSRFVRNYSALHLNVTIESEQTHVVEYMFKMDPRINPVEYGLIAYIYYNDLKGKEYTTVAINQTILIKDKPATINAQRFLIIVAVLTIIIVVGVLSRKSIAKCLKGQGKKSDKPKEEKEEQEEWLSGTNSASYKKSPSRRAPTVDRTYDLRSRTPKKQ